jgi:hypothetical protein
MSGVSAVTADTEDSHVYRVTDDKPTPVPAKSPMVPKLGLAMLNSPSPPGPPKTASSHDGMGTLSQIAHDFGSDSEYSDSEEDDDDEFSASNVQSLAGMVSLGSGRINPPRTSFGSRGSFGSVGSDVGVDNVLVVGSGSSLPAKGPAPMYTSPRPPLPSPRLGYAASSPRLGYSVSSPRDENYPVSKAHRRTSKHSLVSEGHEHVTVVPPARSSGMVPVPHIYSSNENRSESR